LFIICLADFKIAGEKVVGLSRIPDSKRATKESVEKKLFWSQKIHGCGSGSGSRTVIHYGSGSYFLVRYSSGSNSEKGTFLTVPVPQRWKLVLQIHSRSMRI
jgi:hypothetical protein